MRFRCLTFILLTLLLLFVSCTKDTPDFKEVDVKEPPVQSEEIVEETKGEEFEYKVTERDWLKIGNNLSHKEKALEFMSAIHLGDREALELYMQGDTVDELLKIKADFIITSEKNFVEYFDDTLKTKIIVENDDKEAQERYKGFPSFDCYLAEILMTVSESDSEFFPIGVYEYSLKITDSGQIFVDYFGPTERYEIFEGCEIPEKSHIGLFANYKFIENFLRYNFTASDEELLDPVANFDSLLHITVHTLMAQNEDFIFTTTLDDFKEYISLRLGYTDQALLNKFANTLLKKSYISKNDDGSYSGSCAHGYSSLMYDLTDIKSNGTFHTYSYTFYADSAHTIPVKEMQFTFGENESSEVMTLRHLKTAKLNNLNLVFLSP